MKLCKFCQSDRCYIFEFFSETQRCGLITEDFESPSPLQKWRHVLDQAIMKVCFQLFKNICLNNVNYKVNCRMDQEQLKKHYLSAWN